MTIKLSMGRSTVYPINCPFKATNVRSEPICGFPDGLGGIDILCYYSNACYIQRDPPIDCPLHQRSQIELIMEDSE